MKESSSELLFMLHVHALIYKRDALTQVFLTQNSRGFDSTYHVRYEVKREFFTITFALETGDFRPTETLR